MNESIATIADIRRHATNAWHRNQSIADVGPNWNSAAHSIWVEVYAELDAQRQMNEQQAA